MSNSPPASGTQGVTDSVGQALHGPDEMATPDVTKAQAAAIAQAAVAVLVVFGFNVGDDVQKVILSVSTALAAALPLSDAIVRQARAKNAVAITNAKIRLRSQNREIARREQELRLAKLEAEIATQQAELAKQKYLEANPKQAAGAVKAEEPPPAPGEPPSARADKPDSQAQP
jgi:hypothetical protein